MKHFLGGFNRARKTSRLLLAGIGLLATCGLAATVGAQTPAAGEADLYRWTAPDAKAQLSSDSTQLPAGQGAIFIPSVSGSDNEPEALVFLGTEQVASSRNGSRIVVAPGQYTVRIGSGPTPQMTEVPVTVAAGQTAVVPVRWGALRVEVVDENNIPHRGSYELIRIADRQPYTVGFGADTLQGERLTTLLMPPGLYRIVRPGANYRARTDFATVLVPEGGLVHYKLVIDPQTSQFRGAGVMGPEELGVLNSASPWNVRYTVGVSLPFTSSKNVVGASNQTSIGTDIFFDTYLTYQEGQNFMSGIFEIEEGFVKINPEGAEAVPLQKTRDRLRADVLYTRFLHPRVGPYGRFGLLTNVFESNSLVTQDTEITRHLLDGSRQNELILANNTFQTSDAFAPVLLRQGFGVNTRLVQERAIVLDWRVGIGLRQNRFNGAFFLNDDPATPQLDYIQADSFNQEGLETTLVGTVRYRFLLLNTNLDVFGDFGDFDPTIDWRNSIGWRLTRDLSLDYVVDLLRLPQVRAQNQVSQSLLFRYSFGS